MGQSRTLQSPFLVGRDEVLKLFDRKVDEVIAGHGRTLLIAGEAGVGKSRLLGALIRQATQAGFALAQGDLSPQDLLVPLASIRDFARSTYRDDRFGTLAEDLPQIEARKGGDSLASRRILVHDVTDAILAAASAPALLVFEDIHWADELSLEVIGELARRGSERQLLVVATYRPEELPMGSIHREWRARLLTQRVAEEIVLARLTPKETAQVTTLILGTGLPAPQEVSDAVHERTNGIPLHIEELLAALPEAPTEARQIRDATVPSTIEDAVLARASRLSPEAQAVARAGAVIGRCFAPGVLDGILDRQRGELDGALDELVASSILFPFQFIDHGYYDFRHQLLRDAIYDSVPRSELRRLHARAAEFGTELIGASEIHASAHYERAGMRAQAYRAALAGAQAAAAVSSRYEAFELYRRAASNLPDGLSAGELGDLYMAYCESAFAIDHLPAMEETAELARQHYLEAGRPIDAANALILTAGMARRDVRPRSERRAILAQVEAELRSEPASAQRAQVLADARLHASMLELDSANAAAMHRVLDEAAAYAEATGDPAFTEEFMADVAYHRALGDTIGGNPVDSINRMLAVARRAREAHFEGTGVTSYRIAADVAIRVMEYDLSRIGVTEGIRYADEIEQSYCRHVMAATSAHLSWATGDWDAAVQQAELELVQRGSRRATIGSRAALAFVAFGRGDVDRARALLDASLAITRPSGETDLVLPALWGLAETAIIDDDGARALDHCWEAVEIAVPTDERALLVPFVVTGVRAAILDRRLEVAQRWLARVTPMLERWAALAGPAIAHADGLVRLASGSPVAARTALETAIAGWDARGRVWEATWARLDLAAALLRANRHGEGLPLIDQGASMARRLGSLPLLRRAEELEKLARGRGGEAEPWRPLSAREFEVARLIAKGHTNAEIAEQLFVSPKTISAHVEHILAKLGVARRSEIAAWTASITRRTEDAPRPDTPSTAEAAAR